MLSPHPKLISLPPLAMDKQTIAEDFVRYFNRTLGRDETHFTNHYLYEALAYTVRDRLMDRWRNTRLTYERHDARRTCYLSLEFLMGRALGNAMLNLGIADEVHKMLYDFGIEFEDMESSEQDAGLGNGGLGRLAACFLDSCATLQLPVMGYGLRYDYGMFRQKIENGIRSKNQTTGCVMAIHGNWSDRNSHSESNLEVTPSITMMIMANFASAGSVPTTYWHCHSISRFPVMQTTR